MTPIIGIIDSQKSGHLTPAYDPSAYDSIATITVPSGGLASVSFTGIPTGYKHLQLRAIIRGTLSNTYDFIIMRVNGDSTASYFRNLMLADGVNTPPGAYLYTGETKLGLVYTSGATSVTNTFGAVILDVLDYASTTKTKTFRALGGSSNNGNAPQYMSINAGTYNKTNAITSIQIQSESANLAQFSHFALYGVK